MTADTAAVTPAPATSPTDLAVLRDRLVAHAHQLSEVELRYLVQELGLAPEGAPTVTKYAGDRYKLSTDPPEMPPYEAYISPEEFEAQIQRGIQAMDRGEGAPAREVLANMDARIAAKFGA